MSTSASSALQGQHLAPPAADSRRSRTRSRKNCAARKGSRSLCPSSKTCGTSQRKPGSPSTDSFFPALPAKSQSIQTNRDSTFRLGSLSHTQGATASDALRNSRELAQHAESGVTPLLARRTPQHCPASPVQRRQFVIGYIAGGTKTIRVGSGGVMLPNHSPLVIAESVRHARLDLPGRIELASDALRNGHATAAPCAATWFPRRTISLRCPGAISYFERRHPIRKFALFPEQAARSHLAVGSSLFSAQLAARLGSPLLLHRISRLRT